MTDISVTAAQVAPVFEKFGKAEIYSGVAGETIEAGEALYINATTGLLWLTDADGTGAGGQDAQFRGIALNGGGAGQAIDFIMHGCVYGFDLSGESYDDELFLSDTAGAIADAASSTNTVIVGRVFPLSDRIASTGYPNKVLFVHVDMAYEDWNATI